MGVDHSLGNAESPVQSILINGNASYFALITRQCEVLWLGLSGNARTQI